MIILAAAAVIAANISSGGGVMASHENLTVYAILKPLGSGGKSDYLTLDEGLKTGLVVVSEKGGHTSGSPIVRHRFNAGNRLPIQQTQQGAGADVNSVWLTNKSGRKLLLLSGEVVKGGQQDRIIGKDAIIPPGREPIDLGVYCVEHGRWTGSQDFNAPVISILADPSVRGQAQHKNSQEGVWSEVARKNSKAGGGLGGASYAEVQIGSPKIKSDVEGYIKAIESGFDESRAFGVVIAINNRLVWMDRFETTALFHKNWPKLLRSYAIEANSSRTYPENKMRLPSFDEAMRFADARDGKMSYEVQDGISKLVKIESDKTVVYELEDISTARPAKVHATKMAK